MKRLIASTSVMTLLFLSACGGGNALGLDDERLQEATVERALSYAAVKTGEYGEEDIKLVKVCAAIEKGKEDFGHQGDYLVYWETSDGENQNIDLMNESDYMVGAGSGRFEQVSEKKCINY